MQFQIEFLKDIQKNDLAPLWERFTLEAEIARRVEVRDGTPLLDPDGADDDRFVEAAIQLHRVTARQLREI